MDRPTDFESLRDTAIRRAQALSGDLWTDYNVHDPGVAILEQFCYALTELGHRAGFPMADLLAAQDGPLPLTRLGLHPPKAVLQTRPVTARDLAAFLTDACPRARRVYVFPGGREAGRDRRGLYDVFVAPADPENESAAVAQVRACFHANRNLCEDLDRLAPARPVLCRLDAEVEAPRSATPERVAALTLRFCDRFLADSGHDRSGETLTRAEAFDAPALMFNGVPAARDVDDAAPPAVETLVAALTRFPEIARVARLRLTIAEGQPDAGADALAAPVPRGRYLALAPLDADHGPGVAVFRGGAPAPLDRTALFRELRRLRSDARARRRRRMAREEWETPPVGRRRRYVAARIGDGFPANFGVGPTPPPAAAPEADRRAAAQLRAFLAFADAPVANATADLGALPTLFGANVGEGRSYETAPLDFGAVPSLLRPLNRRDALDDDWLDPWRDRKGRALDHLLALYAEDFSQNSLRLYDVYDDGVDRAARVLRNRVRLLDEIATLDRDRGAAPDLLAAAPSGSVGMGRKLRILLDFPDATGGGFTAALDRLGLRLTEAPPPGALVWRRRDSLPAPQDPLAVFVRPAPPPATDASALMRQATFLRARAFPAAVFRSAALLERYVLGDAGEDRADVMLDVGDPDRLILCAPALPRQAAEDFANALAAFMRGLNRACEGVEIVEDVLLRGTGDAFDPLSLHVVFSRVGARAEIEGFRRLAEETAAIVRPAHLRLRVLWLDADRAAAFHRRHLAWRGAARDAAAAGRAGADLDAAGAALRAFLNAAPAP